MPLLITPGLFGISEEIPVPTIRARWVDLIFPLIIKEDEIYNTAFEVISYKSKSPTNKDTTFRIFMILLETHPNILNNIHNSDLLSDQARILESMFSIYWVIAKKEEFWNPLHFLDTFEHIKYEEALSMWKETNASDIKTCVERIERWEINN